MKATFEISLYPLQKKYKKPIKQLIKELNKKKKIQVVTTAMSTYITGDFDVVMKVLTTELGTVYKKLPNSATSIKIIPQDLKVGRGFIKF